VQRSGQAKNGHPWKKDVLVERGHISGPLQVTNHHTGNNHSKIATLPDLGFFGWYAA
jgi:hypothetical protein